MKSYFYVALVKAFVLLSFAGCGCKWDSTPAGIVDAKEVNVSHVDNGGVSPRMVDDSVMSRSKYGISVQIKDTIVSQTNVSKPCYLPRYICAKLIDSIRIFSLHDLTKTAEVTAAFKVYTSDNGFANPISSVKNSCFADKPQSVLLLYDSLQYYGRQRFIVKVVFDDRSNLVDTTSYIHLTK
jgi:hypothetical protein